MSYFLTDVIITLYPVYNPPLSCILPFSHICIDLLSFNNEFLKSERCHFEALLNFIHHSAFWKDPGMVAGELATVHTECPTEGNPQTW